MLLRKYMSLLGIGSAQVDLMLSKEVFRPGEYVEGYFQIHGGLIEQEMKRLECDLVKINLYDDSEEVIDSITILTSKKVDSDESNQISFHFKLPDHIAPSSALVSYRFKTRLIFQQGVKSIDQDVIQVLHEMGEGDEEAF
ncbi:sporulation protein [Bacillus salitolerans]|uniref:Sporulation protein n=1 Tax=Bacillus salitolerans TaxID=1437434 RepID=A0ABW4LSN1_9BACI